MKQQKQPIESVAQMSSGKRKKLEVSDLDSQKSVGKENTKTEAAALEMEDKLSVVEGSMKKRNTKKSEKATKSNQKSSQKAESELNVTLATAATMVPTNKKSQKVGKGAVKENEPKFEFNERASLRRPSSRRGGQKV